MQRVRLERSWTSLPCVVAVGGALLTWCFVASTFLPRCAAPIALKREFADPLTATGRMRVSNSRRYDQSSRSYLVEEQVGLQPTAGEGPATPRLGFAAELLARDVRPRACSIN
jgi:hypothetical protein